MLRLRDIGHFLLLLPLLIIVLLHTDLGSYLVKRTFETELSRHLGAKIEIGELDFSFPNRFTLRNVSIEIDQEAFRIGRLDVHTSLTALLGGQFSNCRLELAEVQYKQAGFQKLIIGIDFIEQEQKWSYLVTGEERDIGDIEVQGSVTFIQNGNINAILHCSIPSLDILAPLFPNSTLTGEGIVDLRIQGPWKNPKLEGDLAIRKGTVELLKSGVSFKEMTADGRFEGGQFTLLSFSAQNHHKGRVTATGTMELDLEKQLPFQVNLKCDQTELVRLADTLCHVSGELIFNGDLKGGSIKGGLQVDELELFLGGSQSKNGHQLEITYINQPFEELPIPPKVSNARNWPLNMDLHLYNNGSISITDDQLTSQWNCDVKLTGTLQAPLLHGDCRLKKGEYLFNGKKFKLTQGTMAFNGEPGKKIQLYVVGEQEVASIHVEVILKGPLDDLVLAFRSTPLLSEKEILCRLLFGRGTAEITPFQGAELTESISTLKSRGGGTPDFLNRIKKSLGIDRIDLIHEYGTDKEEISLQVGKYLSPSVFIGVTKGITTDGNSIGIEADLKNNLKLQAEIADDYEKQVHLKWKYDY